MADNKFIPTASDSIITQFGQYNKMIKGVKGL